MSMSRPTSSSSAGGRQRHTSGPSSTSNISETENEGVKVDFIQRTMLEREASGKRRIKPTFFSDTGIAEDSDDPDFDLDNLENSSDSNQNSDSSSNSDSDGDSSDNSGSSAANAHNEEEQRSEEGESNSSDGDDDSESGSESESSSGPKKTSVLQDFLGKVDEPIPKAQAKKRKRKAKVSNKNVDQDKDSIDSSINAVIKLASKGNGSTKSKGLSNGTSKKKSQNRKVRNSAQDNKKSTSSKTRKGKTKKTYQSLSQLLADANTDIESHRNTMPARDPICAICLGDKTTSINEMVECDHCRVVCHEDCYNAVEDDLSETPSSSSTAPWFCDPCKSGSLNVHCELCPNPGGVFKQTKHKTWVHKVCALYTPGIYSGNNVGAPDLTTIRETKWGVWGPKGCSICQDERLGRIGIPVKCDAAMCKEYEHVTCAQRLGQLSDPSRCSSNEADPFYVSCRAHLPSDLRKKQLESYKVMLDQMRQRRFKETKNPSRIINKLRKVRDVLKSPGPEATIEWDSERSRLNAIPNDDKLDSGDLAPPKKKIRLLDNSALAVLSHEKKAQFTEHADYVSAILLQERHEKIVANVKKKWNVNPSLSVEFAAYYIDRQRRIDELAKKCRKENKINKAFCDKELKLNLELESKVVDQMEVSDEYLKLSSDLKFLQDIITEIKTGKTKSASKNPSPNRPSQNARKQSISAKAGDLQRSISKSSTNGKVAEKEQAAIKRNKPLLTDDGARPALALHRCCVCMKSERQHLIILCDKCKHYYHLSCLDPPLTKKPRITTTCGWMCADCDEKDKEEEDEEPEVDVDAPRSLRGRTNIKRPVKYQNDFADYEEGISPKQVKAKRLKSQSPDIKSEKLAKINTKEKDTSNRKSVSKEKEQKISPKPRQVEARIVPKQEQISPLKLEQLDSIKAQPSVQMRNIAFSLLDNLNKVAPKPKKKRNSRPINGSSSELIINGSMMYSSATSTCATCRKKDYSKNFVTCDSCNLDFHFGCLTPPLKYSPKRKGFTWVCSSCEDPDEES